MVKPNSCIDLIHRDQLGKLLRRCKDAASRTGNQNTQWLILTKPTLNPSQTPSGWKRCLRSWSPTQD